MSAMTGPVAGRGAEGRSPACWVWTRVLITSVIMVGLSFASSANVAQFRLVCSLTETRTRGVEWTG